MYSEWAHPAGGVTVWARTHGGGDYRVLPDGCMDLIWRDGELLVAGPDTAAHAERERPGVAYAGLRFAPGTGPWLLGAPAREVRDLRVPLDALWPGAAARRLAARAADDPVAALTGWVTRRTRQAGPADPLPGRVAGALADGRSVAQVAGWTGLGERQLRRRCEAAFGYGPKTLARVLRLQRALELARAGGSFAAVAVAAGYADQPHLSREVRALAGVPLRELVRR
ncbi:transcriptional regulator, AraC family [Actinacidiphila yanglinensis]|uniref:Transcriptional regulator, AraC family n=1 Tax=Actinacidiphila yanglinensis TaxID=310779 RepID=A0A1H5XFC1_9ACTN|nr:helix-turn-helix domain-containing protein [Actinacidiphila yanglinensis]SEG10047.1 transcriptional regulator, AraC family [Actinacidiphila yanglinensis]